MIPQPKTKKPGWLGSPWAFARWEHMNTPLILRDRAYSFGKPDRRISARTGLLVRNALGTMAPVPPPTPPPPLMTSGDDCLRLTRSCRTKGDAWTEHASLAEKQFGTVKCPRDGRPYARRSCRRQNRILLENHIGRVVGGVFWGGFWGEVGGWGGRGSWPDAAAIYSYEGTREIEHRFLNCRQVQPPGPECLRPLTLRNTGFQVGHGHEPERS